jgi:hypothetical protein
MKASVGFFSNLGIALCHKPAMGVKIMIKYPMINPK